MCVHASNRNSMIFKGKTTLVYSLSKATKPSTSHHHQGTLSISYQIMYVIAHLLQSIAPLSPAAPPLQQSPTASPINSTISSHRAVKENEIEKEMRDDRQAPAPRTHRRARSRRKRRGMYGISGVNALCCIARFEDKACKIAQSRKKIVNGRRCISRSEDM